MHNALYDHTIEALETYKRHNHATVLFGQEYLMFALPPRIPYFKTVYNDIKKRLRRCLALADGMVVTTEPLADALRAMSHKVQVVPNYRHAAVWGDLESQRRQGGPPMLAE